jgi:hypothetical protein
LRSNIQHRTGIAACAVEILSLGFAVINVILPLLGISLAFFVLSLKYFRAFLHCHNRQAQHQVLPVAWPVWGKGSCIGDSKAFKLYEMCCKHDKNQHYAIQSQYSCSQNQYKPQNAYGEIRVFDPAPEPYDIFLKCFNKPVPCPRTEDSEIGSLGLLVCHPDAAVLRIFYLTYTFTLLCLSCKAGANKIRMLKILRYSKYNSCEKCAGKSNPGTGIIKPAGINNCKSCYKVYNIVHPDGYSSQ